MMDLDLLKRMARAIVKEFGSSCEVVVHDLKSADTEHTIVAIENGEISQRQLGDGPSQIVLETLQQKDVVPQDKLAYLTKTRDGRVLKSSTVFLKDGDGNVEGLFSINYDITDMLMAERAVSRLLDREPENGRSESISIPRNVNQLLDDLIEQSVRIVGKPVVMMTKEDKIRAIRFLNESGAFLVTRSGDKVSNYFGISKYTLYSYIDANK